MATRHDTIWQDSAVAANYGISRDAIPFADMHFDVMRRLIAAAGIEVSTVLDLGAGDGIATAEVIRSNAVISATLTDFSSPMLDGAMRRFANDDLDARYVVGDFRENGWYPDVTARGPFEVVVSRFAIHHIPDEMKQALYAQVFAWLKPGGMFVQIEHVASASELYAHAHDTLMVERLHAASGGDERFEDVFASYRERADGGANILAPVGQQLAWMRDIGFVDVDCAFKCFELAVFAGRKPQTDKGSNS